MKKIFLNNQILIFISLLLSFTYSVDIYYNHTSLEDNLYFVFSTFRHGARRTYYSHDYFGNKVDSPTSLTPYGAIQHLEIGKSYRERYSNFLNMSFDPNQIYARSSAIERTIVSTQKQLEGLFGKNISQEYLHIIPDGHNFWSLFQFNDTEKEELNKYFQYCSTKRKLQNYGAIFPILRDCFGARKTPNTAIFCDSVFTSYFEYVYGNDTENKIGKCGRESADKMYNFCVNHYNTFRGWDENAAYMFYIMYQNIIKNMLNAVEGKSKIKMFMVGGHDITMEPFMNFLDGLRIIRRTHYPFYGCNIVFELREYSDEFFLEVYYNDILKYNQTLETFKNTLDRSKYSNLYNKCGIPPWKLEIKTTNIIEIESTKELNEEISITSKVENIQSEEINPKTQIIKETTQKEEISTTQKIDIESLTQKNEPENNLKTDKFSSTQMIEVEETIKKEVIKEETETMKIQSTIIHKKETQNLEIENSVLVEESKEIHNNTNILNNNKTGIIQEQKAINFNSTFQLVKTKLKKIFKQKRDKNLYIILISIVVSIIAIIFIICLYRCLLKRRKKFIRLAEEKNKTDDNVNNNFGVLSVENSKR